MKTKAIEDANEARRGRLGRRGAAFCAALAASAAFGAARTASAADYYVAPAGSDSGAGTLAAPWATLSKAASTASAGDTVYFRAGTYAITAQTKLSKSGTSDDKRISFFVYEGEHAVLDCSRYQTTNRAADTPCLLVTGSYLHIKGFEIIGTPVGASGDHSISTLRSNGGSNNIYELLDIHDSFGPGLFIDTGTGGNLILNCDSHDNYDKDGSQGDGQNADGFGVHYQTTGPSTIIRGCRAWLNSDDGYDLISQEVPVTIEESWAFQNGYANGGSTSPADGNGNGFKVGSSQTGIRHLVHDDVAWKNKASGFYANHSSGGNTWFNNTSYMNGVQYNMLASPAGDTSQTITLTGDKVHRMRNNVGFPNKNSNMGGVDTANNTWDLNVSETNAFVSTSDTGATGPRQADGSLPNIDFLKPKAGGVLIDRGVDVMLPYVGAAPDLGAYEYGATMTGGTGGMAGTGGTAGTAGKGTAGKGGSAGNGAVPGAGGTGGAGRPSGSGGAAVGAGGSSSGGRSSSSAGTGGGGFAGDMAGAGMTAGTSGTPGVSGTTGGTGTSTGGASTTNPGGSSGSGNGVSAGTNASGPPSDGSSASGCACTMPSRSAPQLPTMFLVLSGLTLCVRFARRRTRRSSIRVGGGICCRHG
jgi:hypothetical protein